MSRKSNTHQLTESILGQHLALSVAASLARTQLVSDPLTVYDAQHLTDMLDVVGRALVRVVPVFVRDGHNGEPRALTAVEQEQASVSRGATVLVLKDGKIHSGATMRRGDLRQAIAILKAIGIPELATPQTRAAQEPEASDRNGELRTVLDEIEVLLRPPLVPGQLERANRLALSIARRASNGRVSNLAMQLMSAAHESRGAEAVPEGCRVIVARLRVALEEIADHPPAGEGGAVAAP